MYVSPSFSTQSDTSKAAVLSFYLAPGTRPDGISYWTMMEQSGLSVEARYISDSKDLPDPGFRDKVVTVRGHDANLFETEKFPDGSGHDWRSISWVESSRVGGSVVWRIGSSTQRFAEQDIIEFTNSLSIV